MSSPIAICGIGLRLPGGISTPAQLWDFLLEKKNAKSRVPESRYNVSSYYSKSGGNGVIKTEHGYFLDDSVNLAALDTSFFSFTKVELEAVDPQQRLLLEVVRECLESAGEVDYRGKDIGCFVGSFGDDWIQNLFHDPQMYSKYPLMVGGDFSIPNRISYEYDLRGPSMMIRTACSSATVGLHEACLAIQRGECSAAIVGGCNLVMSPTMTAIMSAKGVLSNDATSKTFDADADGYGRGEAINAIYIKPLADAIRDGNPIRAVVRGTATNCDGKTSGVNVPSALAQESVIRKAYEVAGIDDISDTPFVECHGTGTAVGDPIEVAAIANTFGDRGIYIGAVKPNIGHSEGASGLTSLIKAVLALENKVIPPNINFNTPNPRIPFAEKKLTVPIEPTPWPQDRDVRISVNSFGMGGVNAHVVLESAESFTPPCSPTEATAKAVSLLVFSANTSSSLQRLVDEHQQYLQDHPDSLANMAYTLGVRREHLPFRAASIARQDSSIDVTTQMTKSPSSPPKVVFVFTGQGAQWPGMGVALYRSNPTFRRSILKLEEILRTLPQAPTWSIIDEMMKPVEKSSLHRASYAQPICTAVQIGLADTLLELGVTPYAVVGHSSGELAAAYTADKLTAKEAFIFAFYRGVLSEHVTKTGGMAAVGMGKEETNQFLIPGVVIACENSPSSVTISGDLQELVKVTQAIKTSRPDVLVRQLKVDLAYHSPHMKDVGETYRSHMERFATNSSTARSPPVHFYSSVTGTFLDDSAILSPQYWQSNLESPVLFHAAIQDLIPDNNGQFLFLEIGPHSALSGPIRQTLGQASPHHPYASCLIRGKDSSETFLSALGSLYSQNISLDFNSLTNPNGNSSILTDLPTYPWEHSYFSLFGPRKNHDWLYMEHPKHELLGIRVSESTDNQPTWRNVLPLEDVRWLQDHKVGDDVVFPAAGYLCMAGEAVRQLNTQGLDGFRVREMILDTALLLNDLKTIELVTSLRKVRSSDWYDFTISSHNGVGWVEHCSGQVVGSYPLPATEVKKQSRLPRCIDIPSWYKAVEKVGYGYGPDFQTMRNLSSATSHHLAVGDIVSTVEELSHYAIHPTRIDALLQIIYASLQKGRAWDLGQFLIPTRFAEIEIHTCHSDLNTRGWGGFLTNGTAWGHGEALGDDGTMALRLHEVSLSPISTKKDAEDGRGSSNAVRLYWRPDIQLSILSNLVKSPSDWQEHTKLLGSLTTLCIAQARSRLDGVHSKVPHLEKYQNWLQKQPLPTVNFDLESVIDQVLRTPAAPCAIAMMKVLEHIIAMCKGEIEPLQVLMENDTLFELYNYLNECDRSALFQLLGHHHPKQRILEIGAGTGGSTIKILSETLYSTYTFTDVSAGFFPAAKDRFKEYPNMAFKTLDVSRDPLDQGFEPESFDLIVAANVLHATTSLHETLTNVRKLLHPQGTLLLEELCSDTKFTNFITGVLPGWWAGEADGRCDEPYVGPERWEYELKKAGFRGLEGVAFDAAPPFQTNAFMLAKPYLEEVPAQRHVVLLSSSASTEIATQLQIQLRARQYEVRIQDLREPLPAAQDAIAVVDTVSPFFHELDATRLADFQLLLRQLQQSHSGILWVTRSSQVDCQDPRFSSTIGVARTARSEFGIDFATCELDEIKYTSLELTIDVFEKFHGRIRDDHSLLEQEYVISKDVVHVGRMLPFSIPGELAQLGRRDLESRHPIMTLTVGSYGTLDSLTWAASVNENAIQDDQVEIEVDTVGVNFKDVLITLGIVDVADSRLGLEAAGVVRKVGSKVHDLSPDDRVFAVGAGCFATKIVVSSARCTKIPDHLSLQDAATMPLIFGTVIYSLIDIGQLDKSQTVLIHAASGGVGIAAIQICQMLGATIYATVGSDEKAEHLMKTYAIPREHVFNSRDSSFLHGVMKATNGRGVDIVLNSLSGELLRASCECVTDCGKLIDLTKKDSSGGAQPAMLLRSNAVYAAIDLTDYVRLRPAKCKQLLQRILDLYAEGYICPVCPVQTFAADAVVDCLRYMQSGRHVGKLRISFNSPGKQLEPSFPPETMTFRSDATYLLVGGLGGLGKGIARWMAEHNAKNLMFLSRGAGVTVSNQELFRELESQGCSVTVVQGSICNMADVETAISSAPMPLKGIINLSMVLEDKSLLQMSLDEWNTATGPKVQGTWNLHKASAGLDLDFFMLLSSMCGILGMPGQANYASANTFMDSFVQYRHSLGLPASVIDLGAVDGIGHVADNPQVLERSKWMKHLIMSQKELFSILTVAISQSLPSQDETEYSGYTNPAQIVTGFRNTITASAADPFSGNAFFFDGRLATYLNNTTEENDIDQSMGQNQLSHFVAAVAAEPSKLSEPSAGEFVSKQIAHYVFDLMLKPVDDDSEIDLSRSLSDVGVDSLAAVEVRSWLKSTIGLDISVLEIMSLASFSALGDLALRGLRQRFALKD